MRNILLFGAGRSATTLIKYFLDNSKASSWKLTVVDVSIERAEKKTGNHENSIAIGLDIHDEQHRRRLIGEADIVISMMPPFLHKLIAVDCILLQKNLVTASYASEDILMLDSEATDAGILIMNECGLDPGIDHMSAMKVIEKLKSEGRELLSFKSYTGGLIAPESNDNPWGYKFTWNPVNVITAGQSTARYIENNHYKYIPYNRLFTQVEIVEIDDIGSFDGYANRDSLAYRHYYGLENIPTMLRGTLRYKGFCQAWDIFVRLGLTDASFKIEHSEDLTYAKLLDAFLPLSIDGENIKERLKKFYNHSDSDEAIEKVLWTGIAEDVKINLPDASPAQILQQLLEQKWKLKEGDKDMIVMTHIFEFATANTDLRSANQYFKTQAATLKSSLIVKGDDTAHTAMSKTVGLPLAITAKNILNGNIKSKGVKIPVDKEVYERVLSELENYGIRFSEKII